MDRSIVIIGAPTDLKAVEGLKSLAREMGMERNIIIVDAPEHLQKEVYREGITHRLMRDSSLKEQLHAEAQRFENEQLREREKVHIFESLGARLSEVPFIEKGKTHLRMKSKFQPIPQPVNMGRHRNCRKKKRR